jgi:site-specific recombinase XerD
MLVNPSRISIANSETRHRDRALVSFWLSSGARASELLGLRHGSDLDAGANTITVVSKGTRLRQTIPASVDSFVWLALYLREECPPAASGGPVWWTRQGSPRPLTYHAARAVLQRANAALGTNWTLHDLRHTTAARLLADPAFTLFDVQTILRHASVSTTVNGQWDFPVGGRLISLLADS